MTKIKFAGIVDHSTVDYYGKNSAIVYLCGCPFRCPWCQNSELVMETENCRYVVLDEIVNALKENFLISGVVITGGEPLMQKETLDLIKSIKNDTELSVKIDTNCYFPTELRKALKYIDSLTTDVKAPLDERYEKVIGLPGQWRQVVERIKESHNTLTSWNKPKEARTTIVPGLIDSRKDIEDIATAIRDVGFSLYTLQQFRSDRDMLNSSYKNVKSPDRELVLELGKTAKKYLPKTKVMIVTQKSGFEEITQS